MQQIVTRFEARFTPDITTMARTIKIRNPYATALQKRHGGGVKVHGDKTKYSRKEKHKVRYV